MKKQLLLGLGALLIAVVASYSADGGGPLLSGGANPTVWSTSAPIKFKIDRGKLGPISDTDIQAAIKDAFNAWSNVATASIKFQFDGLLDHDVKTLADYLNV